MSFAASSSALRLGLLANTSDEKQKLKHVWRNYENTLGREHDKRAIDIKLLN